MAYEVAADIYVSGRWHVSESDGSFQPSSSVDAEYYYSYQEAFVAALSHEIEDLLNDERVAYLEEELLKKNSTMSWAQRESVRELFSKIQAMRAILDE